MKRYLVALMVFTLLAFAGRAGAQVNNYCNPNQGNECDEGQAYSVCMSNLNWYASQFPTVTFTNKRCEKSGSLFNGYFSRNGSPSSFGQTTFVKLCTQRTGDGDGPPSSSGNAILVGSGTTCFNGCMYGAPVGEAQSQWSFSGGQTLTYVTGGSRVPTGAVCDASGGEAPTHEGDYCATVGNLTQCLQEDGRHCAVSSSGKRFCWKPKETGTKVSGNEAATKSPQGVGINPPPVPPKNNGEWQQTGAGTASVSSGGTTNNYNITNNTSNYGPDGAGGGAEGEGGGEGEGDDDGFGDAGAGVGTLYERTDKTVGSLVTEYYGHLTNTPFMYAITSFMHAEGGGSCPTFTLPQSAYWKTAIFDAHCQGTFLEMLQAMGWVVLAMAAYLAIKIAVT